MSPRSTPPQSSASSRNSPALLPMLRSVPYLAMGPLSRALRVLEGSQRRAVPAESRPQGTVGASNGTVVCSQVLNLSRFQKAPDFFTSRKYKEPSERSVE